MKDYLRADMIRLVKSGDAFFREVIDLIRSAESSIHLQTYIFSNDKTGTTVANELGRAAKKGVKVFLLMDAFGSKELPGSLFEALMRKGVFVRKFSPLFSGESIYLGRRLHHKILVVDGTRAIVGGINIAEKYRGSRGEKAWLDYAVFIEGACCKYLHELCDKIFKKKDFKERTLKPIQNSRGPLIRFRRNDWIRGRNEIHKSYREALLVAGKSITIVASYFLPGLRFRKLLKKASARGVKVRIILAGRSDLTIVRLAERYLYRELHRTGAQIYEWQDSVMHGKTTIIDDEWVSVGSYNINHLSHYRSIELNVDIQDRPLASELNWDLENSVLTKSILITAMDLPARIGVIEHLKTMFAYYFLRMVWRLLVSR